MKTFVLISMDYPGGDQLTVVCTLAPTELERVRLTELRTRITCKQLVYEFAAASPVSR